MEPKDTLTETLLTEMGMDVSAESIKKYKKVFWKNPHKVGLRGMRLTDAGLVAFERANIKEYTIRVPKEIEWTNQLIIWLDNFIDCPYYISKKDLVVFSEKMAVQLVLYAGDLQKFGLAKSRNIAKKQLDKVN